MKLCQHLTIALSRYTGQNRRQSDITRCKTGANEHQVKTQAIEDKIAEFEDSSFSENTGKLRTWLSYHHNFNSQPKAMGRNDWH